MADVEDRLVVRMEASVARFESQMRRAQQAANTTATGSEQRFKRMSDNIAANANRAGGALTRALAMGGRGRFVLQNTAAQLGDIAVQLQGGAGAARALGQQLPQVLGGFGALGGALGLVAPLLGTVAAIGIPLGAMLFSLGGDADEASDKVETFADKLDAANGALSRAESALTAASAGGLEDLRNRYGEVTIAVTELADALAEIEVRAATLEVGNAIEGIFPDLQGTPELIRAAVSEYSSIQERLQLIRDQMQGVATMDQERFDALEDQRVALEAQSAALSPIREQIDAIAQQLDIWPEDAAAFAVAMSRVQDALAAGDFEAAADRLAEMKDLAVSLGMTLGTDVVRNIVQAESAAREMANKLADAEGKAGGVAAAAGGIVGPVSAAANEAARLAGNLGAAMANLASVAAGIASAQRQAAALAQARIALAGDPVALAGAEARIDYNEQSGAAAYEAIRTGNTGALGTIANTTNDISEGAARVAQLEEQARAAEAAARAAARGGGGGGGGGSGGGGGGGGGGTSDAAREAEQFARQLERDGQRVFDQTRTAVERYNAEMNNLRDLYEANAIDADTFNRAVADLSESFREEQFAPLIQGIEQFSSAIADAIVNGESLAEAFGNILKKMAADIIASGIQNLLTQALSPLMGGGGGGSFLSALIGGGGGQPLSAIPWLTPRASGGPVRAGGAYRIGEEGEEAFFPSVNGRIMSNHEMRAALGAGSAVARGGSVYNIDARGAQRGVGEEIAAALRAFDQRLPGRVRELTSDPRRAY